jgi:hypothetical protein
MRRFQARRPLVAVLAAAVPSGTALFLACTTPSPVRPLPVRDDEGGSPYSTTSGYDPGTTSGTTTQPPSDPPLPDGGKPPGRVFAHTADTLYLFEPLGKTLTKVGKFGCLDEGDEVIDIALDKASAMFATSFGGFLSVIPVQNADGATVSCTYIKKDTGYPNSLGFVPIGTVDATKEALVGYANDTTSGTTTAYVRIDTSTGSITKIGNLNAPDASTSYRSSGDLIGLSRFVNGNRAFLTVNPIDGDAAATDSLAEIDPATGTVKQVYPETGHMNLFGLGQWAGNGYAFADTGEIVQIDMTTGRSSVVTVTVDGGPLAWYGAGVTTDAPTAP